MKARKNPLLTLVAGAAAAVIGLTGCSTENTEAAPEPTAQAPFPRTVEHALGSTEIPAAPKRVVALDTSYSDAVLLLETDLVGYVTYRTDTLPDYLGDARDEYAKDAVAVGPLATPSMEKIAELQPDLIVSAKVRHGDIYEQLSKIAPTVMSETTGPTWKDNIRLLGKALGKEDLAEQKIGAYEDRAAAVGAEINAKANNPTVSVVRFAGEPTARIYRSTSFSGIVLDDAGLARPASAAPDPAKPSSIANDISPELITEAEADLILVSTYHAPDGSTAVADHAKPFLTNPLWAGLRGRKIDVDDTVWMSAVSVQGAGGILDDLAAAYDVDPRRG
ncbi:periplasmic binding family protein [Rhodococcus sp. MTM3W5.2]|uniref:ABC transporter substrate-binding protein n=1 Tax=Rhodococcus sp. MTM3W5.2 TaxID=1805827 RepID=UPI000979061F|nr:iron-siderophore ABC transporter substrate-binding protein [Rhodococcus sp. MTM3W5.2]AQA24575.1 periplasmic binding family protein [Rhodococcus sp. MTM3W5.2]